jgi:predicted RNase H-like HicB family nuclease
MKRLSDVAAWPVDFIPAEEGGFIVNFPDLPNGWSQGEPREEALAQAEGLLDEMILRRMVHYEHIPRPPLATARTLLSTLLGHSASYSERIFLPPLQTLASGVAMPADAPEQTLAYAWSESVLVFVEPGDQQVDKRAYLGAQMPAVGIERIDLKFLRSITGQQQRHERS